MIGLLLVAHAGVADELKKATEMIVGPLEQVETVGVTAECSAEGILAAIKEAVERVSEEGAIIMTDMFGGTPSNMSLSFLQEGRVEVLTGVNLPMLISFVADREKYSVAELAQRLKAGGIDGITVAGEYLKK